jgi:tRNA (adenine57-N1/adenine58-N1)-methyltransferase
MGDAWIESRTIEVLHRSWHIEGMAVRPDHRMVAHTAFLTVSRFIGHAMPVDKTETVTEMTVEETF